MEVDVRTTVSLEKFGQLLEGRHENPFEVLGPHEVHEAGRKALAKYVAALKQLLGGAFST